MTLTEFWNVWSGKSRDTDIPATAILFLSHCGWQQLCFKVPTLQVDWMSLLLPDVVNLCLSQIFCWILYPVYASVSCLTSNHWVWSVSCQNPNSYIHQWSFLRIQYFFLLIILLLLLSSISFLLTSKLKFPLRDNFSSCFCKDFKHFVFKQLHPAMR